MKGFGAVVTGTLISGEIRKEAEAEIFPLGRHVRVRGIEVHNLPAAEAKAGQRTALNLAGIEAREIERGMVLAPPGLFATTARLDCRLTLLPSVRALKSRAKVHFHCWTSETIAEVVLLNTKELRPGEHAFAQLRLAAAGLFLPGDRFIIRQFSPLITLGGGTVLDNLPARHSSADIRVSSLLEVLEHGDPDAKLEILTQQCGEVIPNALVARTGWALLRVLSVARRLEDRQRLIILGTPPSLFVHPEHFKMLAQGVVQQLEQFHAAHPLLPGLSKEDLRGKALAGRRRALHQTASHSPALFNAILQGLVKQGKVEVQGELVRLTGREVQLSDEEAGAKNAISAAFEKAGLAVPSARQVLESLRVDRARAENILKILLKEKALVKVADDLIFHQASLAKLRALLAQRKEQSNQINVGVFKEITGLSRKYAIPLLEYLDRERVTRRQGDERIIL